jgi:hypothetical protein
MRKYLIPTLLFAILGFTACSQMENKVSGTIMDASMNSVTIINSINSDTLTFSTLTAQRTTEDGILIGDYAEITFFGKIKPITKAKSISVKASITARICGSWVEPVPGMETMEQGIELINGGQAKSINMNTLLYKSWKLMDPDSEGFYHIALDGRSIGNDTSFDFSEEYRIDKYTEDTLILSAGDLKIVYHRK